MDGLATPAGSEERRKVMGRTFRVLSKQGIDMIEVLLEQSVIHSLRQVDTAM